MNWRTPGQQLRGREEEDLLQFDGQRDGVEEDVNLEDEEEEESKVFKHLRKEIPEEADVGGQVGYGETGQRKHKPVNNPSSTGPNQPFSCWEDSDKLNRDGRDVNVPSHEAVDGLQVVPRAKQEKGEADDDEEAAQVDEGVLREEPPETGPSVVDWDVLTLGRNHTNAGRSRGTRRNKREQDVLSTCMK